MEKGAESVTTELTEIAVDPSGAEIWKKPYDRRRPAGPGDVVDHQGMRYRILSLRLVGQTVRTLLKPDGRRK